MDDATLVVSLVPVVVGLVAWGVHVEVKLGRIETGLQLIMDYFKLEPKGKQPS